MSPEGLLDVTAVADLLGVRRDHVYELCRRDGMPHKRLGRGRRAPYRFSKAEVLAWLDECADRQKGVRRREPRKPAIYEPKFLKGVG